MSVDFSVIIVTYNNRETIAACLDSIALEEISHEVFVVDNASADGTAQYIQQHYPGLHLIPNQENVGFGRANNQALSQCSGKIIFFLNPDCVLGAGSLKAILDYFAQHPHVGLAGASIRHPSGAVQGSMGNSYPNQKHSRGELGQLPGQIASLLGAAIAAPSSLIQELQGFDPDYFLYGEDQDLCLRARKKGWELGFIEGASVIHVGEHSEKSNTRLAKWRRKLKAEYLFYSKHYSPATIERIRRAHFIKAGWSLFIAGVTRDQSERKAKYQAIWEAACENSSREPS